MFHIELPLTRTIHGWGGLRDTVHLPAFRADVC